jgi:hypothetical protein
MGVVDFPLACKESLTHTHTHTNGIDCLTWFLAPNLLGFFNSYSVNKQGFLEWRFLILWWILPMFSSFLVTHRFFYRSQPHLIYLRIPKSVGTIIL